MHNRVPCNKFNIVNKLLKKNKINAPNQSENSLDLNFIDDHWDIQKDTVADKQTFSAEHLRQVIKKSWLKDDL